jgi:uncharacterized protein YjiS (DUF1127 family)
LTRINAPAATLAYAGKRLQEVSIMSSNAETSVTVLGRISQWWQERAQQRQALEELRSLGDTALEELARDFGITPDQLLGLVSRGQHSADQMLVLLRLYGLDPEAIEDAEPHTFRDMQLNCAMCDVKGRCQRDLKHEAGLGTFAAYCPNAAEMHALATAPAQPKAA